MSFYIRFCWVFDSARRSPPWQVMDQAFRLREFHRSSTWRTAKSSWNRFVCISLNHLAHFGALSSSRYTCKGHYSSTLLQNIFQYWLKKSLILQGRRGAKSARYRPFGTLQVLYQALCSALNLMVSSNPLLISLLPLRTWYINTWEIFLGRIGTLL